MDANGRFEFERRRHGAVWLVTIYGQHTADVEPGFDQALAVVGGAEAVVIDVSHSRMDASELAALLRHARPVPGRPDRVALVGQPGSPGRRCLDTSNAHRILNVFDTTAEAVDMFKNLSRGANRRDP
jgi:hypothetical protein